MSEYMIPIPSRVYNAAVNGHVAGADQIIDDKTGLTLDKVAGGALEEKEHISGSNNGMGRVVLRKNLVEGVNTLVQTMINKSNTIYIIQYDFTLGENITIPDNCILEFDGGSISGNGTGKDTITLNNTFIDGNKCFNSSIILLGTCSNNEVKTEWYNIATDGIASWTNALNSLVAISKSTVLFSKGEFLITGTYDPTDQQPYPDATFVDGIRIKDNSHFIGDNKGTVIIQDETCAVVFDAKLWRWSGVDVTTTLTYISNVSFENIIFKGAHSRFVETIHIVNIDSVDGCVFKNCEFHDWKGDALQIGLVTTRTSVVGLSICKNVVIRDCLFDAVNSTDGTRQAITLASWKTENITIDNCSFSNLCRANMPSAIDYEPYGSYQQGEYIKNISILNSKFENIYGFAFSQVMNNVDADNIFIVNNILKNIHNGECISIQKCANIQILNNNIISSDNNDYSGGSICNCANFDNLLIEGNIYIRKNRLTASYCQIYGNTGSSVFILNNYFKNMIFYLDGGGIFRFENIDNINVQGNIFEDCGDVARNDNSYNMSIFWFTSNQDNVIGVINNNIFKNTINGNRDIWLMGKPNGIIYPTDTNIVKAIQ